MEITEDLILLHGLKLDEFSKNKKSLNREPNLLELEFFQQCGMSTASNYLKLFKKTSC